MGKSKSKFQIKAANSVSQSKTRSSTKKGKPYRPKYYDDDTISTGKSSSGAIIAISLISIIIIAGGIIGIQLSQDPDDPSTTSTITTTTTTDSVLRIEPGYHFNIMYRLWVAEPQSGLDGVVDTSETPYDERTFEEYATKGGLINGFYYAILGMTYLEEKTFSIPACRDEDMDGLDDYTNQEPLGYSFPGNEDRDMDGLYDTNLVYYVKVTYIAVA